MGGHPKNAFIGWSHDQRKAWLAFFAGNARFLHLTLDQNRIPRLPAPLPGRMSHSGLLEGELRLRPRSPRNLCRVRPVQDNVLQGRQMDHYQQDTRVRKARGQ